MLKKIFIIFTTVALVFICSCGLKENRQGKKKHLITIAGSTSVMPFVEKLAEYFMLQKPNFIIDVQGGGSTAGIQACINNTVHLGMSSRKLKEGERLNEIVICYDGISIVVHPSNPINGLSMEQVRAIFSGKIKNWKELGWIDRRIDAITREEGSGTRGSFEELVMKNEEIDDSIMVQDSNGSVKEIVATDPYAIGYISLGLVDKRVKALTIDGVVPTVSSIKTGAYKITRPFLFLSNGEPDDYTSEFIDFVLSKQGQDLLRKEGLIGSYE
ncbi:MAG TPA: phosphate ABC transporter substrate-binding protein [Syntrophorhabdaceae bacterium]|nr:phosphate ABC transporter substrate-binding protein [Syntrophorhabdaceae bacterium]HPU29508.1 phosphate ABC transporter substrate-binding protein [Syntrophorhabdaceae bacterium]